MIPRDQVFCYDGLGGPPSMTADSELVPTEKKKMATIRARAIVFLRIDAALK